MTDYADRATPEAMDDADLVFYPNEGYDTFVDSITGSQVKKILLGRDSVTGQLIGRALSPAQSVSVISDLVYRVNALEARETASIPTFYSLVSISDASAKGRAAFPSAVSEEIFYAVYVDDSGNPLRTQTWHFSGIGSSLQWQVIGDSEGEAVDVTALTSRVAQNETSIVNLLTTVGNQAGLNVTQIYDTGTAVPAAEVIPASVAAYDATLYDSDDVIRVVMATAQVDYKSDGTNWYRVAILPFSTGGAQAYPHPTAEVQYWDVENVRYFCLLREGGDITVSMLDTANGKANWILPQQNGYFYHPPIMHMAEEESVWRYRGYTGVNIGGSIGGTFTLTDPNATISQLQAPPINNAAFTENN